MIKTVTKNPEAFTVKHPRKWKDWSLDVRRYPFCTLYQLFFEDWFLSKQKAPGNIYSGAFNILNLIIQLQLQIQLL